MLTLPAEESAVRAAVEAGDRLALRAWADLWEEAGAPALAEALRAAERSGHAPADDTARGLAPARWIWYGNRSAALGPPRLPDALFFALGATAHLTWRGYPTRAGALLALARARLRRPEEVIHLRGTGCAGCGHWWPGHVLVVAYPGRPCVTSSRPECPSCGRWLTGPTGVSEEVSGCDRHLCTLPCPSCP
jgi:hypothetical protein